MLKVRKHTNDSGRTWVNGIFDSQISALFTISLWHWITVPVSQYSFSDLYTLNQVCIYSPKYTLTWTLCSSNDLPLLPLNAFLTSPGLGCYFYYFFWNIFLSCLHGLWSYIFIIKFHLFIKPQFKMTFFTKSVQSLPNDLPLLNIYLHFIHTIPVIIRCHK